MLNKKLNVILIVIMVLVLSGALVTPINAYTVFPTSAACTAAGGVMGDLNHDGRINELDLDAIQLMLTNSIPAYICGDFDGDGAVGPADRMSMQSLINDVAGGLSLPTSELYDTSFYNPYRTPACQTIFGDVNGDLAANSLDNDIIQWIVLSKLPSSSCADSDGDGFVSPVDFSVSINIVLGLDVSSLENPVISVTGPLQVTLEVKTAYSDLGATVTDTQDDAAGLPITIVTDTSAVNNTALGTYNVTYNATDSDGNKAVERLRQVTVDDTTAPVITLTGANPQAIARGAAYVELGATVTDNFDATRTISCDDPSVVNTAVAGTYTVTYNTTDTSANAAVAVTRTVSVISPSTGGSGGGYSDTTPPTNLSLVINSGAQTANDQNVNLTLGATDASEMMISNVSDFTGSAWEVFATGKTWQLTSAFERKTVYAKFKDASGNISEAISASITLVPPQTPLDEEGEVLGEKIIDERELQLAQIFDDAHYIWPGDTDLLLAYMGASRNLALEQSMNSKYGSILGSNVKMALAGLESSNAAAVTNFLTYGTKTTLKLGAGERAGVLNSYKAAFGKLPQTEEEWRDAIKIGNGRWPSQLSAEAEKNAHANFTIVYKRTAKMDNAHDNAAVTTMAYGLRPLPRNLNSEAAAIKIFTKIYGYSPVKATAWDVVRAIAYSGAVR